ncbi:hypothetical protein PF272_02770 [Gallibacterium sp. AGMB14963]|nr:hypothetical protein [Gallibacterium sp. AGMB14963]
MAKKEKASEKAFKVKNALPLEKINAMRDQVSLKLKEKNDYVQFLV